MISPLDAAIDACGRLVQQSNNGATTDGIASPDPNPFDINGVAYTATRQKYSEVRWVTDHAFLQDIGKETVWPGQVIQGRPLTNGDAASIGPFSRMPGTIQVSGVVSSGSGSTSVHVDSPTGAIVNQAITDILNSIHPTDTVGAAKTDFDKAETYEQRGLSVGLTVKGSAFGVAANATLNEDCRSTTVVGVVRQTYYTAEFVADGAGAAGIWPTTGAFPVALSDLQPYMGAGNPPLLIDSVEYGRMIVVSVTSSHSSIDLKASLSAHYDNVVSGSGQLTDDQKKIIDTCSAEVYTIGVPGHSTFENLGDPAADLPAIYKAGLQFNWPNNPGAVIGFTCRHIADNTLASVDLTAEYSTTVSIAAPNVHETFQWFDGKGSHPVGDSVTVNPGDNLKISASGAIWTGVALSQDTGPEGWPGHIPSHDAPVNQSNGGTAAYCLVAKIGSGNWFEVKNLWQKTVPADQQGALQLASNDNIWTNGDPKKHWDIVVDVRRASAASVGLYV